jgi:ribosome-associated protein
MLFKVNYNCDMSESIIKSILDNEIQLDYIRSPGPGGQNVNKLATAVQLRFDAAGSSNLTPEVKTRLLKLAGSRATSAGEIVINAHRYRSQEKNRLEAIERLVNLIRRAEYQPIPRRPTRPTRSSQEKRLSEKKSRSAIKRHRSGVIDES